ncbi:hypothetical protein BCR34DRAFT_244480 [Clohesyomyces aquaticus]|uniref:Uncharacterized protein n=1 Tax=Clohesyomyces aquaticus TaxID=1231657 RepID=A0A1Y1ZW88_9PLEO|nr:hypothetical protein BCR34DRAFT_244480 [Clohesyomyces aquaticus]
MPSLLPDFGKRIDIIIPTETPRHRGPASTLPVRVLAESLIERATSVDEASTRVRTLFVPQRESLPVLEKEAATVVGGFWGRIASLRHNLREVSRTAAHHAPGAVWLHSERRCSDQEEHPRFCTLVTTCRRAQSGTSLFWSLLLSRLCAVATTPRRLCHRDAAAHPPCNPSQSACELTAYPAA